MFIAVKLKELCPGFAASLLNLLLDLVPHLLLKGNAAQRNKLCIQSFDVFDDAAYSHSSQVLSKA